MPADVVSLGKLCDSDRAHIGGLVECFVKLSPIAITASWAEPAVVDDALEVVIA